MAEDADFGLDVNMFVDGAGPPDLDPYFGTVDGPEGVSQSIALRCYTPRADAPGHLIGAENDGVFLPDFVQRGLTKQTAFAIQTLISGETHKDERVESARVNVTADLALATQKLTVEISGKTAEGPFDLALAVSDVTVDLLNQE